jgi:hypothetical protein
VNKADVATVVDRARADAGAVLASIADHSTATAGLAIRETDRALEQLQDALLVAAFEATRQSEAKAARDARAQVDRALPKPSVKIRKNP